ncbi:pilus assembly protein TadG-related protein [Oricola sp.]|uniref:TadE/TadG family type IV pilus assembly protein n=1 Tax=Oricola sp. TaxID=1979950 RepID=UPI003BA878C3
MPRLTDWFSRFYRDRKGNFGAMFGIGATALLMSATMALDVSRMYALHLKLTQAIDAAVLATTQGLTQGDIPLDQAEEKVLAYIDANLDGRNLTIEDVVIEAITVDTSAKTLQVDAHALMDMTMAGLVGYEKHKVETTSKAQFSNTKVEVVMALDVTGSMGWNISGSTTTKLQALKTASNSAIDTLFQDEDSPDRIRIGLIPYSEAVNAAPVIDKIETTGVYKRVCSGGWWNRYCYYQTVYPDCVRERTGSQAHTDAFANSSAKIGSSAYSCPSSEIVGMSADKTMLKNKINAFTASGCTAGHIAIAWSYYMLSPNWNSAWSSTSQHAEDFNTLGVSKHAIIMTDGAFNTYESSGQYCSGYGTSLSENYSTALCDAMKAKGVKIYSIAFDAGSDAERLMKSCASTSSGTTFYYNATDDDDLEDAFVEIANDIKGLLLIN